MSSKPGELANVTPAESPDKGDTGAATSTFLTDIKSSGANMEGGVSEMPRAPRFKVSGPTALVLVVAAVGIGALLGMRKLTSPGAAVASVKIDYTPISGRASVDAHKRIVEVLDRSSTPVQVPTDQIKKNPFQFTSAAQPATPIAKGGEDEEARLARLKAGEIAARQKKITDELGHLKVNGVMEGAVPVARINGETVRLGDTVADGLFTVTAIGGRSVTLQTDGRDYTLTMEETTGNSKSPRRR